MKKKLVVFISILIFILNSAIPNISYALDINSGSSGEVMEYQESNGQNTVNDVYEEQKADVRPTGGASGKRDVGESLSSSSVVAGTLGWLFSILPKFANDILTIFIKSVQSSIKNSEGKYVIIDSKYRFTIEDLVMGRYKLFDIDFTNFNPASDNIIDSIKQNVSKWYYSLRNIAIVGNLLLLVYIGIRMVISTVAEEQARYRKMFFNWLSSFILLFTMHYIFIILFAIQEVILSLISNLTFGQGFEEKIIRDTWDTFSEAKGWNCVIYVIEILILTYYQIKFFIVYFKRVLAVGFLFVISPLITLMDAVYSTKSHVPIFRKWAREITYNIFIQVVHAAVYAIFILSAASIATAVPVFGMLLLMTLSRTEKIIKSTFGMRGAGLADIKLLDKIKQRGGHKHHEG